MRILLSLFVVLLSLSSAWSAAPTKPVWPTQFNTDFGLINSKLSPPIYNETSHFFYHYESDLQAQLIVYPNRCISVPLLVNDNYPCKLYFNLNGTYLSQPTAPFGHHCCKLIPDVGPIPPEFLKGFEWNASDVSQVDYYNISHQCNYWTGEGFAYWTDMKTDFDVYFNDGGTGNFWLWGEFNVVPQATSIFDLPGGSECQKSCIWPGEHNKYASNNAHHHQQHNHQSMMAALAKADPMIALAMHHHKLSLMAAEKKNTKKTIIKKHH